jgi:hypothetical protein
MFVELGLGRRVECALHHFITYVCALHRVTHTYIILLHVRLVRVVVWCALYVHRLHAIHVVRVVAWCAPRCVVRAVRVVRSVAISVRLVLPL